MTRAGRPARAAVPAGLEDIVGPVRTCIGCRRRGSAAELVRYVARPADGGTRVVADPNRREPGRGAWLHPDPACAEAARKKNAFRRALRTSGSVDDSLT